MTCFDERGFLARHDRPGMLFYLDPRYYGNEGDYGAGRFLREEFAELEAALRGLRGGFILSLNDRPELRKLVAGSAIEAVDCAYSIRGGKPKAVRELIITGGGRVSQ